MSLKKDKKLLFWLLSSLVSDRIAVIHRGEIMGIVRPAEVTPERLGLMMAGTLHGVEETI